MLATQIDAVNINKIARSYIESATKNDVILHKAKDTWLLDLINETQKYNFEEHKVITQDGYILTLDLLTNNKCVNKKGAPVLFVHGISMNGRCWLLGGPRNSLAFDLANEGYQVWLLNTRGTKYSRSHTSLKPDDTEFWNYCHDDIALYDVPAAIDYILTKTGKSAVNYVGHSEGAGVVFALTSVKPEYQKKIRVAIALAPLTWVFKNKKSSTISKMVSKYYKNFIPTGKQLVQEYKVEGDKLPENAVSARCPSKLSSGTLCRFLYKLFVDEGDCAYDIETTSRLFKEFPEPITKRAVVRYTQHLKKDVYQMLDMGKERNLKKYGKESPPPYKVSSIKMPVAILYAGKDVVVPKETLTVLQNKLQNLVEISKVDENWKHQDFLIHNDVSTKLTPKLSTILNKNYT